jgi:hypothetical protein
MACPFLVEACDHRSASECHTNGRLANVESRRMSGSVRGVFPVDGHVHFHDFDRVAPTLEAACRNFRRFGGGEQRLLGAMLLVESAGERIFEWLQGQRRVGAWSFHPVADEPATLIAESRAGSVAVVCGRQIRCERGLEVLAYGTLARFTENKPVAHILDQVTASGALAVLPWGFGKWSGGRAAVIRDVLRTSDPGWLFIGDNGARARRLPEPKLIKAARAAGFRVLPGSDPFPFRGDEARVGAFGFLAELQPHQARPWTQLRAWIEARSDSPVAYGRGLGSSRFLVNQVAMQIRIRMRGAAAT